MQIRQASLEVRSDLKAIQEWQNLDRNLVTIKASSVLAFTLLLLTAYSQAGAPFQALSGMNLH